MSFMKNFITGLQVLFRRGYLGEKVKSLEALNEDTLNDRILLSYLEKISKICEKNIEENVEKSKYEEIQKKSLEAYAESDLKDLISIYNSL